MIRKFCDRCGVECEKLTDIKIPIEKSKDGGFSTKEMAVCETCNKIHENIIKTLIDIRFAMYGNFFIERSENGIHDIRK